MAIKPGETTNREYAIELTSLTGSSPSGCDVSLMPNSKDVVYTVLDSGSSQSTLPPSLIPALYSYLGATNDPSTVANLGGSAAVPCNLSTAAATINFGFGGENGPTISVPVSDFVAPHDHFTRNLQYADGTPACLVSVTPAEEPSAILGDDFLRSAYVVYDLEDKTIALAQSNLAPTGDSDIEEIQPGALGVPGVESEVPNISIDQGQYSSEFASISATASLRAENPVPTQSDFSGTLTVLPTEGSITAQGPVATGTVASGGNGIGTSGTGTPIAPSAPKPTSSSFVGGAVVGRERSGFVAMLVGIVGLLWWM